MRTSGLYLVAKVGWNLGCYTGLLCSITAYYEQTDRQTDRQTETNRHTRRNTTQVVSGLRLT